MGPILHKIMWPKHIRHFIETKGNLQQTSSYYKVKVTQRKSLFCKLCVTLSEKGNLQQTVVVTRWRSRNKSHFSANCVWHYQNNKEYIFCTEI